ncbi:unnamed protein product, partial [Rotaria sordida]
AKYHFGSSIYHTDEFISNKTYITIKETELSFLGNIKDKCILHRQCHFGLDTLSLARLGAKKAIGIDLSNIAIDKASQLAEQTNLNHVAQFICCNIYQIRNYLKINDNNDLFDIVFTSYGTTRWFLDLNKWAQIIEDYLKPDSSFIIVDFHPMVWTFDNQEEHLLTYSYFNCGPIIEYTKGTYTDPSAPIEQKSIRWNHSLSDIIMALIEHHLKIDLFKEFDSLPLNYFNNLCQLSDHQQY